jgi:uncharacterized membrane protein YgdD (TMEM256/DUF423 family)
MNKTIFLTGIFFGTLAILLGAFGAHGLEDRISSSALSSWETGVRYQMYHALLLLILSRIDTAVETSFKTVYYLITCGIICFSFSIYFLATSELTGLNMSYLGLVTPFGGVLLILAWVFLGYRVYKYLN